MTHTELPAVEISFDSAEPPEIVERNTRAVKRDLRAEMTAYGGQVVAAPRPEPRPVDVATIGSVVARIPVTLPAATELVRVLNTWVAAREHRRVSLTLPGGDTLDLVHGSTTPESALVRALLNKLGH